MITIAYLRFTSDQTNGTAIIMSEDHENLLQHGKQKKKKQRLGFRRIVHWWQKRRRFYVVHNDPQENEDERPQDRTILEESFIEEFVANHETIEVIPSFDLTSTSFVKTAEDTSANATEDSMPMTEDNDVDDSMSLTNNKENAWLEPGVDMDREAEPVQKPQVPLPAYKKTIKPPITSTMTMAARFARNRTKDSFQGSLESMDSLLESCWDPEDDESLATPIVTNVSRYEDTFAEHVDFLRVATQPRKVEVVWADKQETDTNPPAVVAYLREEEVVANRM